MPSGEYITVTFNITGMDQMIRSIRKLENDLNDFTDAFEECADDFYGMNKRVFDTEGREIGKPWKPLSESYAESKREEVGGKPILERTGALRRSLTDRNDTNAICDITPTSLTVGSKVATERGNISLLKLHQYGWDKPEIIPTQASSLKWGTTERPVFSKKSRAAHVDARPIIYLDEKAKQRWMRIFQTHMYTKMEETRNA
jgi:phage gpG-like protein